MSKLILSLPHLSDAPPGVRSNPKISIFVSKNDRLDYIHALHIKNIPDTQIYEFESGGHAIVRLLRDRGDLPAIMLSQYT